MKFLYLLWTCLYLLVSSSLFSQSISKYADVKQNSDGTFVITSYQVSTENGRVNNNYTLKEGEDLYNTIYTLLEKQSTDGTQIYNIQEHIRGYYVIAGYTIGNGEVTGNPQDYNYWVIKLHPKTEDKVEVMLFPNPCSLETNLLASNDYSKGDFWLLLFDALGKKLKYIPIKDKHTRINVRDLKPGIYYYKVNSNKKEGPSGKFIVI